MEHAPSAAFDVVGVGGSTAGMSAGAAVVQVGGQGDLAAVPGHAVAVGEPGVAPDHLAHARGARRGGVGERALGRARVAVVRIALEVDARSGAVGEPGLAAHGARARRAHVAGRAHVPARAAVVRVVLHRGADAFRCRRGSGVAGQPHVPELARLPDGADRPADAAVGRVHVGVDARAGAEGLPVGGTCTRSPTQA